MKLSELMDAGANVTLSVSLAELKELFTDIASRYASKQEVAEKQEEDF